MTLTRIVLRLARNPGFPDGDAEQGYVITAPLDNQGRLMVEDWRRNKENCTVRRFKPGDFLATAGFVWYRPIFHPGEDIDANARAANAPWSWRRLSH